MLRDSRQTHLFEFIYIQSKNRKKTTYSDGNLSMKVEGIKTGHFPGNENFLYFVKEND